MVGSREPTIFDDEERHIWEFSKVNDGFRRSPSVRKASAVARTFGQLRDGLG